MNKIYIMADNHGSYNPFKDLSTAINFEKATVIVCGDFGGNYSFNKRDKEFKLKLKQYNLTYFIVRGNHEERPSLCMERHPTEWHMEDFWGNQVYVENDYPYIKYALDIPAKYEIPTAKNNTIQTLILPGAYSVDKYYRLVRGWAWFPTEQCTETEQKIGNQLAKSQNWDLILSHTCPIIYEPTDLFLSMVDQSMIDKTTERWLGNIEYLINYKLWCFGHFHQLRIYPKDEEKQIIMLYNDNALDLYKYFCEKYPIHKCIKKFLDNFK